jgi:hypothetical protein
MEPFMRKRTPAAQPDCQRIARLLGAVCSLHRSDGFGQIHYEKALTGQDTDGNGVY